MAKDLFANMGNAKPSVRPIKFRQLEHMEKELLENKDGDLDIDENGSTPVYPLVMLPIDKLILDPDNEVLFGKITEASIINFILEIDSSGFKGAIMAYPVVTNEGEKYEIESVKYAESSSEREKIAQKVERDAEDIKKAEYMQNKIGEVYTGIVSSVTSFGMFVELENTVEGLVRFEDMGNEYFEYDGERKLLRGEKTNKTYSIGDKVTIEVKNADKLTRKIDFKIKDTEN